MRDVKVSAKQSSVTINFIGKVAKNNVVSMIERCQTGGCDCMDSQTKAKITQMRVEGKDGDVRLVLEGDGIDAKKIEAAAQNAKLD